MASTDARRKRERDARRDAIVDAAEAAFDKSGWEATMDEVATLADLSKGTLYLYFEDKEELLIACSLRILTSLGSRLDEIERLPLTGVELVTEMAAAYVDQAMSRPERFRNAMHWLFSRRGVGGRSQREWATIVNSLLAYLERALIRGRADGSLRPNIEPACMCLEIWAALLGAVLVQTAGGGCLPASRHDIAADLALRVAELLVVGVSAGP